MAYTIVKSDGTLLTTIADGDINTSSTSLGLPGRNYAGYGQTLDTNYVHQLENFADANVPQNPIRGQLWYNTTANTLYVCPADGTTNGTQWLALAQSGSSGTTTFGAVNVIGDLNANNVIALNNVSGANGIFTNLSVTAVANIATANVTTGDVGTLNTKVITTGGAATTGTLTGAWTLTGASEMLGGTSKPTEIWTDVYKYANGNPISFAGTYNDSNVASYLPTFTGTVGSGVGTFRGVAITTGASGIAGTMVGNWTLGIGSKFNATYADLAERFAADAEYDAGTVVEIGGTEEITAVKTELSENILGVVSMNAAYLMNAGAGSDKTHPPVAIGGRVPVKAVGVVRKGDRLVSAGDGAARSARPGEITAFNSIGQSLADKFTTDLGTVEAIVTIKG